MTADFNSLTHDGCVVIPGIIAKATIQRFEETLDRFATQALAQRGGERRSHDAMTDLLTTGGEYRRRLFPLLKNLLILREMEHVVIESLLARGFPQWAGMEALASFSLFKADVPGESKYLLPMHQDYNTPCHRAWRAWVPLREATEANGTLRFVRGSHKSGFIPHNQDDPERPEVDQRHYDPKAVETLRIQAGDIFLFHPLLVHASVPASDDRMKYALIVNFWDLATLADPEDVEDPINQRILMGQTRDVVRGDRDSIKIAVRA